MPSRKHVINLRLTDEEVEELDRLTPLLASDRSSAIRYMMRVVAFAHPHQDKTPAA